MRGFGIALLTWIIYPLWLLAGVADVLCHRRTHIERTSGAPESVLHLAQLALVGAAVMIALLLEINAGALLAMVVLIATHSALSLVDVSYTSARRHIPPFEQFVHNYLEVLPWTALSIVAVINWHGISSLELALRPKAEPFSPEFIVAIVSPALLIAVPPVLIELFSTLRHRRDISVTATPLYASRSAS